MVERVLVALKTMRHRFSRSVRRLAICSTCGLHRFGNSDIFQVANARNFDQAKATLVHCFLLRGVTFEESHFYFVLSFFRINLVTLV
jgi:hypothetical protein